MVWSLPLFTHAAMLVQICWNVFVMVQMVWARGWLASRSTDAGAHTWPNALASNPLTNPTCRQLCLLIPIKSGLQDICESSFRKELWEQWSLFDWWKWRIINQRKSCYIIMYIILFIVVHVQLSLACCVMLPMHSFHTSTLLRYKYLWNFGANLLNSWHFHLFVRFLLSAKQIIHCDKQSFFRYLGNI